MSTLNEVLLLALLCGCMEPTRPGPPPSATIGSILIVNQVGPSGSSGNSLRATLGVAEACTRSSVGEGCTLIACGDDEGFDVPSQPWGELTFTGFTFYGGGGDPMTTTLTLPYRSYSPRPTRMWSGGELIAVTASTAGFSPFRLEVPAPSPFTVSMPACTSSDCSIEIDRSRALQVAWSPAKLGAPVVELSLSRYVATDGITGLRLKRIAALQCRYSVDAVGATISPEQLSLMPPAVASMSDIGSIEVRRVGSGHVSVPEGTLSLDAIWSALSQQVAIR
ncbi:MAG: hypothetical protein Q8L48_43920 [Archangium sp.]|nr:hypothetical protein [Archangium sp.]